MGGNHGVDLPGTQPIAPLARPTFSKEALLADRALLEAVGGLLSMQFPEG